MNSFHLLVYKMKKKLFLRGISSSKIKVGELTLTLKVCTEPSKKRMLQTTSDRVFSLGSSEVRMLLILPPNARNREVITIVE